MRVERSHPHLSERPTLADRIRILAEAPVHAVAADALALRASLTGGDYAALARVAFAPSDPRNQPATYRNLLQALDAQGARAFTPCIQTASALTELAARILTPAAALTEPELRAVSTSCESLARVHMGQWHIPFETLRPGEPEAYHDLTERLRQYGRGGSSLTNRAISDAARIAYDLHQVIRRELAYRRSPGGGWTTDFDPPLKTAPHPLPRLGAA